ncbi:MAG: hypothetical protein SFV53_07080 [Rickettsiales bacterium]|nr:hypothetical protein [Rickettsiales bacterium]
MKKFFLFFCFFILLQNPCKSWAQVTIFNVPSADVTKKDKNFIQHESQFRTKKPKQFINVTSYFAHGIGYNTEIDVTQFNLSSPASKNATIAAGFKTVMPLQIEDLKTYQPKIILGAMLPFSLQGQGIGSWFYASNSFVLPQTNSRFTAGISFGSKQIFGKNATSFIGGFEQKITEKISFINDWYSGNNSLGIFASGFSYSFPKDLTIFAGYQIPNSKQIGRNSIVIEIAKNF